MTGAVEVTAGFSGGPVLDEATRRVIGMITVITAPDSYGRGVSTAFAIPMETLRVVCSELVLVEVCPYRGLAAFSQADEVFFHGRDRAVGAVLAGMERDPRVLAVLGPSGSGKTSLVQAGVLPRLARGALPGSNRWGMIVTRPADDPLARLEDSGLVGAGKDLGRAVARWHGAHDGQRLMLVIDQFEELLVSVPAAERSRFVDQLVAAVEGSQPLSVMLVMRDDFYAPLAESAPALMPWVARNLVNIPATVAADELAAMVARPASTMRLRLEPGLAKRIVAEAIEEARAGGNDHSARSTVLPLLEFALAELWERRSDGCLRHHAYEQIGGVTGGLSQWCDRVLAEFDAGLHPVARRVVTALVRVGEDAEGVPDSRRRRMIAELGGGGDNGAVGEVVRRLTAARLLVTSRGEDGGQASVELVHEALLRQWGLLRQWLAEDRDMLAWRQRIERTAAACTPAPLMTAGHGIRICCCVAASWPKPRIGSNSAGQSCPRTSSLISRPAGAFNTASVTATAAASARSPR